MLDIGGSAHRGTPGALADLHGRQSGCCRAPEPSETRLIAQTAADLRRARTLPYQIGSNASFDYVGFNGRWLSDDVMDVMLSLMTNTAVGDGVAPDPERIHEDFPYFTISRRRS